MQAWGTPLTQMMLSFALSRASNHGGAWLGFSFVFFQIFCTSVLEVLLHVAKNIDDDREHKWLFSHVRKRKIWDTRLLSQHGSWDLTWALITTKCWCNEREMLNLSLSLSIYLSWWTYSKAVFRLELLKKQGSYDDVTLVLPHQFQKKACLCKFKQVSWSGGR